MIKICRKLDRLGLELSVLKTKFVIFSRINSELQRKENGKKVKGRGVWKINVAASETENCETVCF